MQEVFKELSGRDKGAARLLREKLDELKRAKGQEAIAAEWAQKAEALLGQSKLNIADALAWQRDAAKAGAPLSREPLAGLKAKLAERVKGIEDLQHRAQVHREAAVLLAQRFEVLSTKGWQDAQAAEESLRNDVTHWQQQAADITADINWNSLDAKFAPQLEASKSQLLVVSDAFHSALAQAIAAAADAAAPLPPVPVWADELRSARGEVLAPKAAAPARPAAPKIDPAVRAAAQDAVQAALAKLEQETAEGHGKASAGAAAALRAVLKEHGKLVEPPLEARVHAALVAAGELEGWQRWSADKVREDLVAKAEGLLKRPEGQALGGRKMQETLRALRDQWKQADQGGVPNHALWKRFDEACNEAHKVVEAWLEKVRADAAEHRAHRVALIEEVKAWAAEHAGATDLKAHNRALHQFADRWRDAGHVGEKVFAELQPQWNEAFGAARAPFETAQKASVERRQAMIAEAVASSAPSRCCASTPSRRCSSAGSTRRRACRSTAATNRSCGTRSARPSTKPSTARRPSAKRRRPP
jgi:ATP-dependent RNA helicase SUPV3L1/SUV3